MERLLVDKGTDGYDRWRYVLALMLRRRFKYILEGGWGFKSVRFDVTGRTEFEVKEKMFDALKNGIYCLQKEKERTEAWMKENKGKK